MVDEIHKCDRSWTDQDPRLSVSHGPAITEILKENGVWYADNDEYETRIRFCPFCGLNLDVCVPVIYKKRL